MVNYSQFNESDDAGKRGFRCLSVYVITGQNHFIGFILRYSYIQYFFKKNKLLNDKIETLILADSRISEIPDTVPNSYKNSKSFSLISINVIINLVQLTR